MLRDFLHWYIGLFSAPSNDTRIAAWAATVATLGVVIPFLIVPIWKAVASRFGQLRVEAGMTHELIQGLHGATAGMPHLVCTIINRSSQPLFVEQPMLKTSRKIDGYTMFSVLKPGATTKYPLRLEPGQKQQFECNLLDLNTSILRHLRRGDEVRFRVRLTTGKAYLSRGFTRKFLDGHLSIIGTQFK